MDKLKKITKAFSLVELMISLITISLITAAFTPIISKQIKSSAIMARQEKTKVDCAKKFSKDCLLCDSTKCFLCAKKCASNEYLNIYSCQCKSCSEVDVHCTVSCEFDKQIEGSSICTKCSDGFYIEDGQCKKCEAGYKCPDGIIRTACYPNNGEYQDEEGQTNCKSCRLGVEDATNNCNKCASSTSNSCATCKGGYKMNGTNCAKCDAGYYSPNDTADSTCTACTKNKNYCSSNQTCSNSCNAITPRDHCTEYYTTQDACKTCDTSYEIDGSGCKLASCDKGLYKDQDLGVCNACPEGQYQPKDGSFATSCTPCPAGTYTGVQGSPECTACPAGKTSKAGATECVDCDDKQCKKYSEGCTCTKCNTGYKVSNGKCVGCGTAGCAGYSSGCTCNRAEKGWVMNGSTPEQCYATKAGECWADSPWEGCFRWCTFWVDCKEGCCYGWATHEVYYYGCSGSLHNVSGYLYNWWN